MNDRESLARDLILAVASSHITESEPSWETVADRLLSYGWGRLPKAPLVVVDPTDPAVIDRVARALYVYDEDRDAIAWEKAPDWLQDEYRRDARAALAALGGDQPVTPMSLSMQRRLDVMRGDQR